MISIGGSDRFHRYNATARWQGSTAAGYEDYDRRHEVIVPGPDARLELSADEAFRGDAGLMNPELMLISSVVSCQLLSFLAVAARSQIEVVHYEDNGEAVMPDVMGRTGITTITLNPRITVRGDADTARIKRLVELAHQECYVANTLKSLVILNPEITVLEAGAPLPADLVAPMFGVPAAAAATPAEPAAPTFEEVAPPDGAEGDFAWVGESPVEAGRGPEDELVAAGPLAAREGAESQAPWQIDDEDEQEGAQEPAAAGPPAAMAVPAPAAPRLGGTGARRPAPKTRAVLQRFVDDEEGYQQWVADHPDGYVLHTTRGARRSALVLHHPNCKVISGVTEDGTEPPQANLKLASTSAGPIESWCKQIMRSEPDLCEECMG